MNFYFSWFIQTVRDSCILSQRPTRRNRARCE